MTKTIDFQKKKKEQEVADDFVSQTKSSPCERMKKVSVELPETLHRRVKATCAMRGQKVTDVVRELLLQQFPEEESIKMENGN